MNLIDYLKSERGRASALARALGITPVLISQWANGVRQVPAEYCPAIERQTSGSVRCEVLRPDVDWGYIRTGEADPDAGRIVPLTELP